MNFINKVKTELIAKKEKINHSSLAFLYGVTLACGSITTKNKQMALEINCSNSFIFEKINEIISSLYGGFASLETDEDSSLNHTTFNITIEQPFAGRLLEDLEILIGGKYNFEFNEEFISADEDKKAFLEGLFIACASSTIKIGEENSSEAGYHLEFVLQNEKIAEALSEILAENYIIERTVYRGSFSVVYLADYESVLTLIGILGASKSYLELESENVRREFKKQVNRQNNFINANLNKLAEVSAKQILAIKQIDDIIGIRNLPIELYEVAKARLDSPEASTSELADKINSPITKSGINHRLRKLLEISKNLKN